jgi:1,5-anhydro-D-fructose reductase (1,5-anhydro-D-mannitol-forming)
MPDPITVAVLGFWHVHAAEYAAQVHQHSDSKLVAIWETIRLAGGQRPMPPMRSS